ncbi:MAG: LysM peptidoglycan-binding domain-containing protein [Planctomycetota bacterium]
MIPLILAGIGIGAVAYWVTRKILHKPSTWQGFLATALVAGVTGGVGGVALDALWAAGVFATQGAVAGVIQDKVVEPVKDVVSDLFGKDEKGKDEKGNDEKKDAPAPSPAPDSPVVPSTDDNTIGGTYVVKKGDTLYSLARRAHVSVNSLAGVNPSVGPDFKIFEGQTLNIPCPNIDTAGPGAPKSEGCAAAIAQAFNQNRNNQKAK